MIYERIRHIKMENRFIELSRLYIEDSEYNRSLINIIDLVNKEYDKLSYPEKIIWDCASIYNEEFIMPMMIYGKAIDMEEYDIFCKEIVLNLKNQEFL